MRHRNSLEVILWKLQCNEFKSSLSLKHLQYDKDQSMLRGSLFMNTKADFYGIIYMPVINLCTTNLHIKYIGMTMYGMICILGGQTLMFFGFNILLSKHGKNLLPVL